MVLINYSNAQHILEPGKEILGKALKFVKESSEEITQADTLKEGIARSVVQLSQLSKDDLHKTAEAFGRPLSDLATEIVNDIEQSDEASISRSLLNVAKKYKVDPNTVVNVYLRNGVEQVIDKISESKEEIEEAIVKEVIKDKIKSKAKSFSIKNLFIKIYNKIKAFFLTLFNN